MGPKKKRNDRPPRLFHAALEMDCLCWCDNRVNEATSVLNWRAGFFKHTDGCLERSSPRRCHRSHSKCVCKTAPECRHAIAAGGSVPRASVSIDQFAGRWTQENRLLQPGSLDLPRVRGGMFPHQVGDTGGDSPLPAGVSKRMLTDSPLDDPTTLVGVPQAHQHSRQLWHSATVPRGTVGTKTKSLDGT